MQRLLVWLGFKQPLRPAVQRGLATAMPARNTNVDALDLLRALGGDE